MPPAALEGVEVTLSGVCALDPLIPPCRRAPLHESGAHAVEPALAHAASASDACESVRGDGSVDAACETTFEPTSRGSCSVGTRECSRESGSNEAALAPTDGLFDHCARGLRPSSGLIEAARTFDETGRVARVARAAVPIAVAATLVRKRRVPACHAATTTTTTSTTCTTTNETTAANGTAPTTSATAVTAAHPTGAVSAGNGLAALPQIGREQRLLEAENVRVAARKRVEWSGRRRRRADSRPPAAVSLRPHRPPLGRRRTHGLCRRRRKARRARALRALRALRLVRVASRAVPFADARRERRARRGDVGEDVDPAERRVCAALQLHPVALPHARMQRLPQLKLVRTVLDQRLQRVKAALPLRACEQARKRRQQREPCKHNDFPRLPLRKHAELLGEEMVLVLGHDASELRRQERQAPRERWGVGAGEVDAHLVLLRLELVLLPRDRGVERAQEHALRPYRRRAQQGRL
eukprot:4706619-Pleurochrysis_carterae.AAC.7